MKIYIVFASTRARVAYTSLRNAILYAEANRDNHCSHWSIKSMVVGQPDATKEICYASAKPNHPLDRLIPSRELLQWKHVVQDKCGKYSIEKFNPEEYVNE